MSREFDAFFTRLVTDSLSRSAAGDARRVADARVAPDLRARLALRRAHDRLLIVRLLETAPDSLRGYLAARNRVRRARALLVALTLGSVCAAVSLAVAAWWDGTRGVWVACADAALIACGIVGCFAYVTLVSAQASAAGRLRVLEHQGPERRVGVDRRKTPVSLPAAIERRSGIDRRATPTPVWSG